MATRCFRNRAKCACAWPNGTRQVLELQGRASCRSSGEKKIFFQNGEFGDFCHFQVYRGVRQQHVGQAQASRRVFAVHPSHRRVPVPLLPAGRNVSVQQLPVRLHLLCRVLHPGSLPAYPDQSSEQIGVLIHLAGKSIRRLPVRSHRAPPGRHQFCRMKKRPPPELQD